MELSRALLKLAGRPLPNNTLRSDSIRRKAVSLAF